MDVISIVASSEGVVSESGRCGGSAAKAVLRLKSHVVQLNDNCKGLFCWHELHSSASLTNSLQCHLQAVPVSKFLCTEPSPQQLHVIVRAETQGKKSKGRCEAVPGGRETGLYKP